MEAIMSWKVKEINDMEGKEFGFDSVKDWD